MFFRSDVCVLFRYTERGDNLALTKDVFDNALVECIKGAFSFKEKKKKTNSRAKQVMELDLYPKFLHLMKDVKSSNVKV
jgi:hypothetical protein